ncbi:MAG: zinc-ribbon domain-containing protein [Tissierellia bacterium]|nr:zinc-ribbon domain-containing protein [Tissierellia bacterium]
MNCPHCGKELNPSNRFCTNCGQPNESYGAFQDSPQMEAPAKEKPTAQPLTSPDYEQRPPAEYSSENRYYQQQPPLPYETRKAPPSAHSEATLAQVPGKFNWGAFSFTLMWGIGNKVYLCLLALIPGVNLIISILAGLKGNQWALQNNQYRDMEEFSRIQETWSRAGFVFFIITLISTGLFLIPALFGLLSLPFLMGQ